MIKYTIFIVKNVLLKQNREVVRVRLIKIDKRNLLVNTITQNWVLNCS